MTLRLCTIAVLTMAALGCTATEPQDIKGTWDLYSSEQNGKTNIFDYNSYVEYDGCTKKHYIQFRDNRFTQSKIDFHTCKEQYTVNGTYKVKANTVILTEETEQFFEEEISPIDNAEEYTLSFSVTANKLTLKNKEQGAKIVYVKRRPQ